MVLESKDHEVADLCRQLRDVAERIEKRPEMIVGLLYEKDGVMTCGSWEIDRADK